jgi:hypothetical protein
MCLNSESEICDPIKSTRLDAAGVDGIPLSFIKLLLPAVLPVLTHIFNHIFVSLLLWCCRSLRSVAQPSFLIIDQSVFLCFRGVDGLANRETNSLQ